MLPPPLSIGQVALAQRRPFLAVVGGRSTVKVRNS
jgi:hypothetical protein